MRTRLPQPMYYDEVKLQKLRVEERIKRIGQPQARAEALELEMLRSDLRVLEAQIREYEGRANRGAARGDGPLP